MKKTIVTVTVKENSENYFGEIKINFIKKAFERSIKLKDELRNGKYPPNIRLALLKEIYSIYVEMQAIQGLRTNFEKLSCPEIALHQNCKGHGKSSKKWC